MHWLATQMQWPVRAPRCQSSASNCLAGVGSILALAALDAVMAHDGASRQQWIAFLLVHGYLPQCAAQLQHSAQALVTLITSTAQVGVFVVMIWRV